MTTGIAPAQTEEAHPPTDILAERYAGLMIKVGRNPHNTPGKPRLENNSKLYYRLAAALDDLVYGLLQNDLADVADLIVQDLRHIIRDESVRLVAESHHASWEAREARPASGDAS